MHFRASFERNTQGRSERFSGLQRLLLGAGDNQCGSGKPSGGNKSLNALGTDGIQVPRLHRNLWIDLDLRMGQIAHECCHRSLHVRSGHRTAGSFRRWMGDEA